MAMNWGDDLFADESVNELRRQFNQAIAGQGLNPAFRQRAQSQFNPMLTRYQTVGGPDYGGGATRDEDRPLSGVPSFMDFMRLGRASTGLRGNIGDRLRNIYGYYGRPQFGSEADDALTVGQQGTRDMFSQGQVAANALGEALGGRGNIFAPYMRQAVQDLFDRLGGDVGIGQRQADAIAAGGTAPGTFLEEAQRRGLLG